MYYLIHASDKPDSLDLRLAARADHLARIQALRDAGRLLTAGPLPAIDSAEPGPAGYCGSCIIAKFSSLTQAEQWVADDPYQHAGVYASVEVKPFLQVF